MAGNINMRYETIAEQIEVIVHFSEKGVNPLRFLWRGAAHKVEKIRGRWTTLEGRKQRRHFAITAANVGSCEIIFDLDSMKWKIESVAILN